MGALSRMYGGSKSDLWAVFLNDFGQSVTLEMLCKWIAEHCREDFEEFLGELKRDVDNAREKADRLAVLLGNAVEVSNSWRNGDVSSED